MRTALLRTLNGAYRASLAPSWARFLAAAARPQLAQRAKLLALMQRLEGTAFAGDHDLMGVKTLEDYQARVPVRGHDGFAPYLRRMELGEPRVLTADQPRVFEPSSGSTQATKLIPYTQGLLDEFSAATGPWLYDLLTQRPALRSCSSYWSISPAVRRERLTAGGERIGFEDDTQYFPAAVRHLLRVLLPVPPQVSKLESIEACRYVSLRYLLADRCLGLISVWSPSFLTLLLEFARAHADRLAHDVREGAVRPPGAFLSADLGLTPPPADRRQADAVLAAFPPSGPLNLEAVWPSLSLVSCWTEAGARPQLAALRRLLPDGVEVQGKGLLATEGVVSFPLLGREGCPLAVASHLLELRPLDGADARPISPERAEVGGRYQPILSTAGGLCRYALGDSVEVTGRYLQTPLVRFTGRIDGVSDLCGEKLSPARVEQALRAAREGCELESAFTLLTPADNGAPGYVLYAEAGVPLAGLERLRELVELRLREGHHYDYCRELGQLQEVRLVPVRDGARRYEGALLERGMRAGDIKPPGLHRGAFWDEVFASQH